MQCLIFVFTFCDGENPSMDDYIQEVNILKGDKLVRLHDLHYLLTLSNLFRRIMLLKLKS